MAGDSVADRLAAYRKKNAQLTCSVCGAVYTKKQFCVDNKEMCGMKCFQSYITKRNAEQQALLTKRAKKDNPSTSKPKTPESTEIQPRRSAAPLVVPRSAFLRSLSWKVKVVFCSLLLLLSWWTGWMTVCVIILMFYGIYEGTDERKKAPGEMSAYSVFNPNCEAIQGTFKAEDFDKSVRQGFGMI
eukprot:m.198589 g.198589  ORF g.198589 m.198589 type:complete len:186 (+) comp15717_c0_seq21:156-713(+)